LPNRQFEKWTILDWSNATGSDQEIIGLDVDMLNQEDTGGTQVVGWKLAAMTQEDMERVEKLWREHKMG
jgi:hypothetical protein